MSTLETKGLIRVPTTDITLHYRDWGGQGPTLLLVHGLASSSYIWSLVAPLLIPHFRVVAYDQRSHAQSEKTDAGFDFSALAADGEGLAQALRLSTPYIVVGHSWGASVVLEWTVRYPEQVQGCVLVDGALASLGEFGDATWETVAERLAPPTFQGVTLNDLLTRTADGEMGALGEEFRRSFFASLMQVSDNGTISPYLTRERHMQILRTLWEQDIAAAYRSLQRPALVLAASQHSTDPMREHMLELKHRAADRLAGLTTLAQVHWMEETIHDVPLQRPRELAELIIEFARSL